MRRSQMPTGCFCPPMNSDRKYYFPEKSLLGPKKTHPPPRDPWQPRTFPPSGVVHLGQCLRYQQRGVRSWRVKGRGRPEQATSQGGGIVGLGDKNNASGMMRKSCIIFEDKNILVERKYFRARVGNEGKLSFSPNFNSKIF